MEKYLYLTKHEWQRPWIHGGNIPINLASTYLRQERDGIFTPDETLIHKSPVDLRSFFPNIGFQGAVGISMIGCTVGGREVPSFRDADFFTQDGNILSFCNVASIEISQRLGKVCCVKILDLEALKRAIDEQLGVKAVMGPCTYTPTHERNHFLKSIEDSWQNEYRMFWLGKENQLVTLPAGVAVPVEL
jgi:hypothetical protein